MGQEMLDDTANGMMRSIDVLMNDRQDDIKAWAALPVMLKPCRKSNTLKPRVPCKHAEGI